MLSVAKRRCLDISGNKSDMQSRITYYMTQPNGVPPIPEPPGGSASTLMNVLESLFAMISRLMGNIATHAIIGPQGTSICSRGPRVRRIPYKSGQFFWDFLIVVKKLLVKNIQDSFFTT
jgi:hypothetical protein